VRTVATSPKRCRGARAMTEIAPFPGRTHRAVGSADLSLLLYPVYYCLVNGPIAASLRDRPRSPHGSGPEASKLPEGVP
jgi:hypothetical protein